MLDHRNCIRVAHRGVVKPLIGNFLKKSRPPNNNSTHSPTQALNGIGFGQLHLLLTFKSVQKHRANLCEGSMEQKVGLLFLFLLGATWACKARQVGDLEVTVVQISKHKQEKGGLAVERAAQNDNVCALCEEFATKAVDYLAENKTQTEILDILHISCSRLASFKQQCITLVDYYASLFFSEISNIQPADFCRKVNLCQQIAMISLQVREDSCGLCHHAVSEVLIKLKDPDTQLEILELLLKGCNSMQNYVKKCKKLVFEYGPLILANAEQFLETTDVCTMLHACESPTSGSSEQAAEVVNLLAES